jgi:hypothetical protein
MRCDEYVTSHGANGVVEKYLLCMKFRLNCNYGGSAQKLKAHFFLSDVLAPSCGL